ncbi:hypothetical protein ACFC18_34575 [Streptomyces sp. NPDC056121]|uniref:hypothetical protein n=1 Tax=Streptomyces TaxID=1883 RepID=UPI001D0B3EFE|nr:hypothetical protein [Streptomyces longhuiensis]UDL97503.1 hypothetical protein LGI35_04120 [Streptomyces longhuiensis]
MLPNQKWEVGSGRFGPGAFAALPSEVGPKVVVVCLAAGEHARLETARPTEQLDKAVNRWVADILACAPTSLRAIKQMVQRGSGLSPQDAHKLRTPALMAALDSEDGKEGVLAFQQKRPPVWPGR